jgi:hypothetical protein
MSLGSGGSLAPGALFANSPNGHSENCKRLIDDTYFQLFFPSLLDNLVFARLLVSTQLPGLYTKLKTFDPVCRYPTVLPHIFGHWKPNKFSEYNKLLDATTVPLFWLPHYSHNVYLPLPLLLQEASIQTLVQTQRPSKGS